MRIHVTIRKANIDRFAAMTSAPLASVGTGLRSSRQAANLLAWHVGQQVGAGLHAYGAFRVRNAHQASVIRSRGPAKPR